MHEGILTLVSTLADGSTQTVTTALITTAGFVITGAFGLVIAAIQRERSPRSTVPATDASAALLASTVADLRADYLRLQGEHEALEDRLELCEAERDTYRRTLTLLRSAVRRHDLDPDTLIEVEETFQ